MNSSISNIRAQNTGMETAFQKKQIVFTKQDIAPMTDEAEELRVLQSYNAYLKEISKQSRPPAPPPKPKLSRTETVSVAVPDEDPKPVFNKFTDMNSIKRMYFGLETDAFDQFAHMLGEHPFRFYTATYKYAADYKGRPSFVAKNAIRGFVQNLELVSDYLMVRFLCFRVERGMGSGDDSVSGQDEYEYMSVWIVNSSDPLTDILGSMYDDFTFTEVSLSDAILLWKKVKPSDMFIGETYLH